MQTKPLRVNQLFGALADATRRDIVRRAIDQQEGIAELTSHYPMSFAAVQKHVAILERAGLVTKRRIGRRKVVAPIWKDCAWCAVCSTDTRSCGEVESTA
jgi:DNA-binding transcriptional ArsR family regulator